ncbi:hypothetical protein C3747_2g331 [Trypanosoma cruzi]|uniref:Uncharacterized protein n=2 Tax=Trypanosoma cruzi TaxID=5693 RepID=Q4DK16_TRYCC|nr:hypothetical protein, conserved [Trypanosoma cruzi]EAN92867.1 hypothetical protein, conserved [Trypanosoma cruzi]PWV21720.1 hypothetical protein C3747_2g331 [Trypanosoma cruzi]RNC48414.1 hypothetical protein TcCL_NonESM01646 [Trypanosoma cruzi]|eukprot:XP_814718.1 hypothetical protein [Trypanosoma cruzi strain CL Brener]
MASIRGGVGGFLIRRAAVKSVRQKYQTGPQFNKRKFFQFPKGYHRLHLRIGGVQLGSPTQQREHTRFSHLPGDTRTRPQYDFTFGERRADGALYAWRKRGNLQLYQMGGKPETFVCYRCGYPVRSQLVAIKGDNWDYRMCYKCYTTTVHHGMENDT